MLGIDVLEFKEKVYEEFGVPQNIGIFNGQVILFNTEENKEITDIQIFKPKTQEQADIISAMTTIEYYYKKKQKNR